jgi:RHS repeat-associated protein
MQNRFDPWGNYVVRDFTPFFPNVPITFRGFTGHEHYPEFKIINMNGRLYDPIIGRFFSPDKYVANSSFTQDFNRYSYARNCPLMYTDPSGELAWFVPIIIGAVVAATSYTVNVACSDGGFKQNWNWDKFVFNTMFGAVTGAFSMGIGAAVGGALASVGTEGIKGIAGGAITGAANGLFSGTLSGLMQYGMSGDKNAIWRSPLMGMGIGAGIGALNGMADALNKDKNVWLGRDRAMGRSNWSFKNTDKSATHVWKGNTHYGGRSQGMIGPRETRPIERYEQAIQNEKYRVIRELENWITPTHPECPPKTTVFVGSMRGRGSGNYSGWVAEGFELHIDFDGQNILTLPHGNYPPTTITIPSETMIIDMYFTGEHPPFPLPTQAPFKFLIYGVPE